MKLSNAELPRSYWAKLAKRNGISDGTFRTRAYRGWSYKAAATTPPRNAGNRTPQPESTASKQRAAGLDATAVWRYRQSHPDTELSVDQIIEKLQERRARPNITEIARKAGLSPATVLTRIGRQGWTLEQALTRRPMTHREAGKIRAQQMHGKGGVA
ncbi:hypothetical protein ACUN9Y_09565 [Halomonas sp. V046]|uniref:hypothetical protein n=1 Tax=Halomonas sp. V046 TaxID=3459611 RepID=UPI004044BA56